MTWIAHRLVLRLMSPLHVGQLTVGNLQRTRHYVPGKTLWGALTARLTRDFPDLGGNYDKVGQLVNEELAFSYSYPALKPEVGQALYPDYTEQGLRYGPNGMAPDEFAWRLISSYASTAVDARRTAAEEASLHEAEFISPRDRETGCPVCLVGYVFEQEGCKLPWQDALNRLQLGGERKYGWGRVCTQGKPDPIQRSELFDGYEISLEGNRPIVTVPEGKPLLAHTIADDVDARGQVEPLLGRETRNSSTHGRDLSNAQICWTPGSRLDGEEKFALTHFGVWAKPNSPSAGGDHVRHPR